jgi:hypothetical protein
MREHYWAERVAEFDRHLDRLVVAEREALLAQNTREVMAEYMGTLQDSRDILRREMNKLRATAEESAGETVKLRDLTRLMEVSIRADRLLRGESTDKIDMGPDLSNLSDDELARREALLDELEKVGRDPSGD